MNNNNGNSKYVTWGVGWLRNSAKGAQFVSGLAGDEKQGLRLLLQNNKGENLEVKGFAMLFNSNKKTQKSPDVRFVVTVEE